MKFTLEIDCDSDAFAPVADDASEAQRYAAAMAQVAFVLRTFAEHDVGSTAHPQTVQRLNVRNGFLRDANGNRCGQWSIDETD